MNLEYAAEMGKVYRALGEAKLMVLATSAQGRTTARTVSCVMYGGKIAFQTSTELTKYRQLAENPRVALCVDNISIEGIARPAGHPLSAANEVFANLYKRHFRGSFEAYSAMASNVVIEVTPLLVTVWGYEQGEPYRLFLNAEEETAYLEMYDHSR